MDRIKVWRLRSTFNRRMVRSSSRSRTLTTTIQAISKSAVYRALLSVKPSITLPKVSAISGAAVSKSVIVSGIAMLLSFVFHRRLKNARRKSGGRF